MQARPSEVTARDILQGIFQEVEDLCQPGNDGVVAPWQMASHKLNAAAHACHEVVADIKNRPVAPPNLQHLFKGLTDGFQQVCG